MEEIQFELLTIEDEGNEKFLRAGTNEVILSEINEPHVQEIIARMRTVSKEAGGLGIAAPQIGSDLRMFLMEPRRKNAEQLVVINPKVKSKIGKAWSYDEGCLSVPDQRFDIKRAKRIIVEYYDEHGEKRLFKSRGKMEAFIMQHELDHLEGILVDERSKK
jgi:peptide deformylase